jgi:hypothetical protein
MLTILGRPQRTCAGSSRRLLLQAGGAGLLGLSLPKLLAAEAAGGTKIKPRAKSVIFLFLFGGPSQLETYDLKPEAPAEIRGPFQPIGCRTPGLLISEHLPKLADISDKFAIIRTLSHDFNDHSGGAHFIQTGHRWHVPIGAGFNVTPQDWPAVGSVVSWCQRQAGGVQTLPPYVVLPNFLGKLQEYTVQLRRPGETAGWLGRGFEPLVTRIDKRDAKDNPYWRDCTDAELQFRVQGLDTLEGLTLDRMSRRDTLREQFDRQFRLAEQHAPAKSYGELRQRAFDLVTSSAARDALNVLAEPAALRDRYGKHLFGQSCLAARRLVEAGVRFVTVHYDAPDGYSWDSHRNSDDVKAKLLPSFDEACSALLTDLSERGLLDETLVVAMGEMGRTPRANKNWGRDHWSTLFPALLAGAGIRGGVVHGETDKQAGYALSNPVKPVDLAATLFHALGVDPSGRVPDALGRPHPIAEDGEVISNLFG